MKTVPTIYTRLFLGLFLTLSLSCENQNSRSDAASGSLQSSPAINITAPLNIGNIKNSTGDTIYIKIGPGAGNHFSTTSADVYDAQPTSIFQVGTDNWVTAGNQLLKNGASQAETVSGHDILAACTDGVNIYLIENTSPNKLYKFFPQNNSFSGVMAKAAHNDNKAKAIALLGTQIWVAGNEKSIWVYDTTGQTETFVNKQISGTSSGALTLTEDNTTVFACNGNSLLSLIFDGESITSTTLLTLPNWGQVSGLTAIDAIPDSIEEGFNGNHYLYFQEQSGSSASTSNLHINAYYYDSENELHFTAFKDFPTLAPAKNRDNFTSLFSTDMNLFSTVKNTDDWGVNRLLPAFKGPIFCGFDGAGTSTANTTVLPSDSVNISTSASDSLTITIYKGQSNQFKSHLSAASTPYHSCQGENCPSDTLYSVTYYLDGDTENPVAISNPEQILNPNSITLEVTETGGGDLVIGTVIMDPINIRSPKGNN